MAGGHERRSKRRFDSGGANQDESGSSRTNMTSDRELRPRERKSAASAVIDDIMEESEHTSNDEDDVEDSPYRVEKRHGKTPVHENSSEEEMMRKKRKVRKGKKISLILLYRGLSDLAQEKVLIIMERE